MHDNFYVFKFKLNANEIINLIDLEGKIYFGSDHFQ